MPDIVDEWEWLWQAPKPQDPREPFWPLDKGHWDDPVPEVTGMLSSQWIRYYATTLGMIQPFKEANLKPASYELTLGPRYQREGHDGVLTREKQWLVIPKNSVAFVSMGERLMLPHYIAARFNLSIDWIYQGLLLGTGPQVDPGFKGVLSCPLHNISNNPIRIKLGEPFTKIDFIKVSHPRGDWPRRLKATSTEDDLYDQVDKGQKEHQRTGCGDPITLFRKKKCWKEPIFEYPPGKQKVSSSVAPLERTIRRFRLGGLLGLIAFVGIAAGLISMGALLLIELWDANRDYDAIAQEVQQLQLRSQIEQNSGVRGEKPEKEPADGVLAGSAEQPITEE